MVGSDEPPVYCDPEDPEPSRAILRERAKRLAQKETPPEIPSGGAPLSIHDR